MNIESLCKRYAQLTRLSAQAMAQGNRREAAIYQWELGLASRETDTWNPEGVCDVLALMMHLQSLLSSNTVLSYRRTGVHGSELN
jgi:hypothetical protein